MTTKVEQLKILRQLGYHNQVLTELPALRARMAELPGQRPCGRPGINPQQTEIKSSADGSSVSQQRHA